MSHKWFNPISENIVEKGVANITKCLLERLKTFKVSNNFQQEIIRGMVDFHEDLPEIDEKLKYVFFYLDYTCNGVIEAAELKKFFSNMKEEM